MYRYLLTRDGVVFNVVVWDGVSPWEPGDGLLAEPDPGMTHIGWIKQLDGSFAPPPSPPAPEPTVEDLARASARVKLAAIGLTEEEIAALVG